MVWFKIDDGFYDHPKVEELLAGRHGADAIALWTLAGAWCARQLTDGAIPAAKVARLGIPKHAQGAAELVRAGLWITTETGYRFHGWAEMQPLREDVTANRRAAAGRQRKHRNASVTPHVTRDTSVTNSVSHTPVTASVTPLLARAFPDPTRPDPFLEEREHPPSGFDSYPLDVAPRGAPSQEPQAIALRLFAAKYLAERGLDWIPGPHVPGLDTLGAWAEAQGRRDGKTTQQVLVTLLENAWADPYLAKRGCPPATLAKQAGELYRPPAKTATGPPRALDMRSIREWSDEIEAQRRKEKPDASIIADRERRIAAERANPSVVVDEPARRRA